MRRSTVTTAALTLLSVTVLLPIILHAQTTSGANNFQPLANYGTGNIISNTFTSTGLVKYLNAIFTVALSFGAIAAVMRIAYAGYMYMGSADMWGSKQKAKEILGNAIVGLLMLLSVWLVLHQINPDILNLNILKTIQQSSA